MNDKTQPSATPDLEEFLSLSKKYLDEHRKREAAEQARRARLTPAQRAAEDKAVRTQQQIIKNAEVHKRLLKIAHRIQKADTWPLDDFAWLLTGLIPEEGRGTGFNWGASKAEQRMQRDIRALLYSCLDTALTPVNPASPSASHRFRIERLMQVATDKRLGYYFVLRRIRDDADNGPLTPARIPAKRAVSAQNTSRKRWHAQIHQLMAGLQRAAQELKHPFDPKALPGSWKSYQRLIAAMCKRADVADVPPSHDAVRKKATELGYALGGKGARASNSEATLRRWAKAAHIEID